MPKLSLLVFGLEQYEQPTSLTAVRLPEGDYTAKSRLTDKQLGSLMEQMQQGAAPLAKCFTRFKLEYLLDGMPVGHEEWLRASEGLKLLEEYFEPLPVIDL